MVEYVTLVALCISHCHVGHVDPELSVGQLAWLVCPVPCVLVQSQTLDALLAQKFQACTKLACRSCMLPIAMLPTGE